MMKREHNCKILATLGPSSSSPELISALYHAGADAFRLNFSHGTHKDHEKRYAIIRELEESAAHPIGVVADLQGPKLRIGKFANGPITLKVGQEFRLDMDKKKGDVSRVTLPHKEVFSVLKPGMALLLNDGKLRLEVIECGDQHAITRVTVGGVLSDSKGLNVPDAVLPLAALTAKDRRDLAFAVNMGVDWIALSFVQRPEDIADARRLSNGRVAIMAKIEKPSAVQRFQEILELSDGIMVARGDLGVELTPEEVPAIQKQIVRAARRAGKPVVVATQMLESMIEAPSPTRAEVSDVATAVYDGGDATMLSAESAAGAWPVESVDMMHRIIRQVEGDPLQQQFLDTNFAAPGTTEAAAITAAADQVARAVGAAAIVTYSQSGATALRAARQRPTVPIVALIPEEKVSRRLSLSWGLRCVRGEDARNFNEMIERACRAVYFRGYAAAGSRIIITAGVPFGTPGTTNLLHIAWIRDYEDRRDDGRPDLV